MILGIDIGNTRISFASLGKKITNLGSIETQLKTTALRKELENFCQNFEKDTIDDVLICSVVPDALPVVEEFFKKKYKISPKVIGRDLQVPIKNKYQNPKQVGMDRLVGSFAAREIYGKIFESEKKSSSARLRRMSAEAYKKYDRTCLPAGRQTNDEETKQKKILEYSPLIVIDFGTAITFDVISEKGEYEGGLIVPGIRLSLESLSTKAALLPNVQDVKLPRKLIGRNTKDSILSGILNGYGSLCDGLVQKLSQDFSGEPHIILTGGYAKLMEKLMQENVHRVNENLVFQGMFLI